MAVPQRSLQPSIWSGLTLVVALSALLLVPAIAVAAPPWASMIPFKRVDADPKKSYATGLGRYNVTTGTVGVVLARS